MLTNDQIRAEFDSWMMDRRLRWAPILCDTLETVVVERFATFCELVRERELSHPEGQIRQWIGSALWIN